MPKKFELLEVTTNVTNDKLKIEVPIGNLVNGFILRSENYIEIHNFDEKVEAIKELYEEPHRPNRDSFDKGFDAGIEEVLRILEIKISGVNDQYF